MICTAQKSWGEGSGRKRPLVTVGCPKGLVCLGTLGIYDPPEVTSLLHRSAYLTDSPLWGAVTGDILQDLE